MKIAEFLETNIFVKTDFSSPANLRRLNFTGVYALADPTGEIVYIGKAYSTTHTIKDRLNQYRQNTNTGNRGLHDVIAKDKGLVTQAEILDYIRTLTIYAFHHTDTEQAFICSASPKYNKEYKGGQNA